MNTDVIADMLTRIRNAINAGHISTTCPYSKLKDSVLKVLKDKKFITNYSIWTDWKFKNLEIVFNEDKDIISIKRVSKPGQRIYVSWSDIKSVVRWYWISIISTSQWVMAWYEAYKKWIWGEIICEIY